jgi:hypothetical protein
LQSAGRVAESTRDIVLASSIASHGVFRLPARRIRTRDSRTGRSAPRTDWPSPPAVAAQEPSAVGAPARSQIQPPDRIVGSVAVKPTRQIRRVWAVARRLEIRTARCKTPPLGSDWQPVQPSESSSSAPNTRGRLPVRGGSCLGLLTPYSSATRLAASPTHTTALGRSVAGRIRTQTRTVIRSTLH